MVSRVFAALGVLGGVAAAVEGAALATRAARGAYEGRAGGADGVLGGFAEGIFAPVLGALAWDTGPGTKDPSPSAFQTASQDATGLPQWALDEQAKKGQRPGLATRLRNAVGGKKRRDRPLTVKERQERQQRMMPPHVAEQVNATREQTRGAQTRARRAQANDQRELVAARQDGGEASRERVRVLALRRRLRELTAELQTRALDAEDPSQVAQLEALALATAKSAEQPVPPELVPDQTALGRWVKGLVGALMTRPAAAVADALQVGRTPEPDDEAELDEGALLSVLDEEVLAGGCSCGGLDDDCGGDDLAGVHVPLRVDVAPPLAGAEAAAVVVPAGELSGWEATFGAMRPAQAARADATIPEVTAEAPLAGAALDDGDPWAFLAGPPARRGDPRATRRPRSPCGPVACALPIPRLG